MLLRRLRAHDVAQCNGHATASAGVAQWHRLTATGVPETLRSHDGDAACQPAIKTVPTAAPRLQAVDSVCLRPMRRPAHAREGARTDASTALLHSLDGRAGRRDAKEVELRAHLDCVRGETELRAAVWVWV